MNGIIEEKFKKMGARVKVRELATERIPGFDRKRFEYDRDTFCRGCKKQLRETASGEAHISSLRQSQKRRRLLPKEINRLWKPFVVETPVRKPNEFRNPLSA